MPDPRYFRLHDHIGVEPPHITGDDGEPVENPKAGELQPFHAWRTTYAVPKIVKGELTTETKILTVTAKDTVGDGRTVKVTSPEAAAIFAAADAVWQEVDPPAGERRSKTSEEA